jgi:DNA polymerase-3 subunit beta
MKLECEFNLLREAVGITEKTIGRNLPLPILSGLHISTNKKGITIRSTNLDIGVEVEVKGNIEKNGTLAVPASIFSHTLQNLPHHPTIRLEEVNGNLNIICGKSSLLIKAIEHKDFPTIPRLGEESKNIGTVIIPIIKFTDGLRATAFASTNSDMKPEIASVYVSKQEFSLVFVATDSFRLAEKKIIIDKKIVGGELRLLLPIKNVNEILRIFEGRSGDISIFFTKNQVSFNTQDIHVTSRLIDGLFPDYEQIIPKGFRTEAVVSKSELFDSLKLSSIFSDKFQQVHLRILPEENLFEITSRNQDAGESTTALDGTFQGENIDLSVNGRYLLDSLQSIPEDEVVIHATSPDKAITLSGKKDKTFTYLAMPLHT